MGGRGASSGTSKMGNKYGTQYKTLLTSGNIKFVEKTGKGSETLMETATRGRVYVRVDDNGVRDIVYFDSANKRAKQIDLSHKHSNMGAHTHHGYMHNENDTEMGAAELTAEERKMVDKVLGLWKNRGNKR